VHVTDALLRCADKFLAEGKGTQAVAIYTKLCGPGMPRAIRLAALQGQLNAAGDGAGAMTLELLAGDDADARAVAAGHMARVLRPATLPQFAAAFPRVPVPGKLLLIGAMARSGDKAAMPLALSAARSDEEPVRLAGLRALAKLGDASAVPTLLEATAAEGDAAGAARESLRRVFGEGVDEAIIAAMQRAETDMRGTLIDVLNARSAVAAAPALLKEATHEDAGIRTRAMRALGNLAEPEHIPAMTAVLLSYEGAGEREEAEKAIVRVCERTAEPEEGADGVVAALTAADEEGRRVLLPLVGRLGGEQALAAVQEALRSEQEETRDAAVAALCNWPDAAVADELLELAGNADKPEQRRSTLRAYVRVIESRPERERLAMYQQAMALAERDHERKVVLKAVASARSVEALRWAVPYLDTPALAMDASRAVVDLAKHGDLRRDNHDEFRAALNKVIDVIDDSGLIDRAKRHLGEL
jgi:HEAT repeat protein